MNDYFSAIGENLLSNLQPTQDLSTIHHIYRISSTCPDLTLHYSTLLKDILTINPKKTTGSDCVSPRDLKLCGESIITGLQPLFKLCLVHSTGALLVEDITDAHIFLRKAIPRIKTTTGHFKC